MDIRQYIVAVVLLGFGVAGPSYLVSASEADGSPTGVEDEGFQVGSSCAGLAYLSSESLQRTIKDAFSDDRHSFCYPEEPSECADYTSLLQGLGRLATGEDGYHCNLQVAL